MCDDLVTFVLLYHASQLCTCGIRQHDLSKSPTKSNVLVGNRNVCDRVVLIR